MKQRRFPRTISLLLLIFLLSSMLVIVWYSYPEPIVRRLSWLRRPGAYAIYISQSTDKMENGSIRMMVLGGSLTHTTIQTSILRNSEWVPLHTYYDLPIQSSTSFWAANDVAIGGTIQLLDSQATSSIESIWYDFDEGDEGNSFQFVICLKANTSEGDIFVGRFAVGCGLVTAWYYPHVYHLYLTNIFLGVYSLFSGIRHLIVIAIIVVGIIIAVGFTVKIRIRKI